MTGFVESETVPRLMRIAFLINSIVLGGAEVQVVELAKAMRRRGHDVLVVTVMTVEKLRDDLGAADVAIHELGLHSKLTAAVTLVAYCALLRRWKPDIVHAHMFASILLARLGRVARRHVLVETTHTPFEQGQNRYRAYAATSRLAGHWTCVSQEGIDSHTRGGAVSGGLLVRNGVDMRALRRNDELRTSVRRELNLNDEFVWLSVGSFRSEQKDFGNLVHAFRQVHAAATNCRLLIAGGGILLEEKRGLARELGLDSVVTFLGLRSDVRSLMSAADGFVLASSWEALPMVLLEAAAASLPTVATNVGDVRSIVHPDDGRLVPPNDSAALAAAMLDVSSRSASERAEQAESARKRCLEMYGLDHVVTRWEQLYSEWLRAAGSNWW